MAATHRHAPPDSSLTPLVLFAQLQLAVERGDHETAAATQRELAKRGITVRYGLPSGKAVADVHR